MSELQWGGPEDALELVKTSLRGLELPGHVLRQVAEPVDFEATSAVQRSTLVQHLFEAMHRGRGIGLAAPMVGVSLRVVVAIDEDRSLALFNPEIVDEGPNRFTAPEGNLCLPGVVAEVERPSSITVKWRDADGAFEEEAFEGSLGRTLFHELELLDGNVFTDRVDASSIASSNLGQRAAAATSHVFGKPEKRTDKGETAHVASCLTLPPSLVPLGGSVLRRPADPVDLGQLKAKELRKLIEAMFRQQYEQRGVGLAGPQIGLGLRLAVIDNYGGEPLALINPEILDRSDETETNPEGCLSIPGWSAPVSRSTEIRLRNHTVDGRVQEKTVTSYLARIIQHETDHLDGVLYIDHVESPEDLRRNDPRALAEETAAEAGVPGNHPAAATVPSSSGSS